MWVDGDKRDPANLSERIDDHELATPARRRLPVRYQVEDTSARIPALLGEVHRVAKQVTGAANHLRPF
jgi:hypothetical protein